MGLLEAMLRELGLGRELAAERLNDTEIELRVAPLLDTPSSDSYLVSIADVGFGVSQVLPVLVALLVADAGQLVYVEQPELHLHPRAQCALARMLAETARCGVRLIVETHSLIPAATADACMQSGFLKHFQNRVGIIFPTGGFRKRPPVLQVESNRFVRRAAARRSRQASRSASVRSRSCRAATVSCSARCQSRAWVAAWKSRSRRWRSSWWLMRTAPVGRTVGHARCGALPTWLPERPVAAGRPSTRTPPSPPACARRTNTGWASAAFRPRPWRPSRGASTSRSPASGYPGRTRSGGSATAAAIAAQSVVLPAPAGTVKPCSAVGGLFEAESCHRRWSRSRSVLPPAAPSTLRSAATLLPRFGPAIRIAQHNVAGA